MPVLSKAIALIFLIESKLEALFNKIPCFKNLLLDAAATIGIAIPKTQGQTPTTTPIA